MYIVYMYIVYIYMYMYIYIYLYVTSCQLHLSAHFHLRADAVDCLWDHNIPDKRSPWTAGGLSGQILMIPGMAFPGQLALLGARGVFNGNSQSILTVFNRFQ